MSLGTRIREARKKAGLSQAKLAELVGIKQQAIQKIEKDPQAKTTKIVEIASVLSVSPEWLVNGVANSNIQGSEVGAGQQISPAVLEAPVIGTVRAGDWTESPLGHSGDAFMEAVPCVPTERHRSLPQYALKVGGNSMDKVVRDGEYVIVVLCDDGAQYVQGDRVVVERQAHGLYERTLKKIRQLSPERIVLEPESTDDSYTPIEITSRDDFTVRIIGVALGKYAHF